MPLPDCIEPMLAVLAPLPVDPLNWAFEYKWDGVRCMAYDDGRRLTLRSRNQIIITQRYPELAGLAKSLGKGGVILDGEIIALDRAARPSFAELQRRMHVDAPPPALVRQTPVWYVIFDILYAGGRSLIDQPYVQRRATLEQRISNGDHWHLSPSEIGVGAAMLQSARDSAMEGVVAKLLSSAYEPGRRSPAWRKIKIVFGQELVIGGWIPEAGGRLNRVGALLLGYHNHAGDGRGLRYAGRVGTGFTDATHARLVAALTSLAAPANPFIDPLPRSQALFVKPSLVADVQYRRWPSDGQIQQASFKGLRTDKPATDVVRETGAAL